MPQSRALAQFQRALAQFHVGQPVILTAKAIRLGLQGRARTPKGRVTSFRGGWLCVRRDGLARSECYDPQFWEPFHAGSRGKA